MSGCSRWNFADGLPETSNCYCHPGIAGGSPAYARFKALTLLDDDQWPLVLAFLIGALRPSGPYAFLAVEGEQGSGKSLRCELCKAVIDPGIPMRSSLPKSVQDLMIIANHSHVIIFDNLSGITAEMSDALAALSTKAGFRTRQLYTDAEVHAIEVTRPFMLNGIGDFIRRPDLMDRAIPLRLEAMPETIGAPKRRSGETSSSSCRNSCTISTWRSLTDCEPLDGPPPRRRFAWRTPHTGWSRRRRGPACRGNDSRRSRESPGNDPGRPRHA